MPSQKALRRAHTPQKAPKVKEASQRYVSSDLCSHCLTPFASSGRKSHFHPLWRHEVICNLCVDRLCRCQTCERKAVPWSFPQKDSGNVVQFDVLVQTPERDCVLSSRMQIEDQSRTAKETRYVCGRCRAVGLITSKDQAIRELRFILESLYLHFGILFTDAMIELQRIRLDENVPSRPRKHLYHHVPSLDSFRSQEGFESWLHQKCSAAAMYLPLRLFWGQGTQLERAYCQTGYFQRCDGTHPSVIGLPFVDCIQVEYHISRPKFWALMVHEIVHAYLHLYRGLDPNGSKKRDDERRMKIEDGLAHAITQLSLENVLSELLEVPEMRQPTRAEVEIGPPPVQMWMVRQVPFIQDLPYSKPALEHDMTNWGKNSPYYSIFNEEFEQISFVINKLRTDQPYQQAFKKALNLIRSRTNHRPKVALRDIISEIIVEFVRDDYLPKT